MCPFDDQGLSKMFFAQKEGDNGSSEINGVHPFTALAEADNSNVASPTVVFKMVYLIHRGFVVFLRSFCNFVPMPSSLSSALPIRSSASSIRDPSLLIDGAANLSSFQVKLCCEGVIAFCDQDGG